MKIKEQQATKVVDVSPAMARQWLKLVNAGNRPIRQTHVYDLLALYQRGEWKLNPHGIIFGQSGRLLDGQHRLMMISLLPEAARVPLVVHTGWDDALFTALDQGIARTVADIFDIPPGQASVARQFAMIYQQNNSRGLSAEYVGHFANWIEAEFKELVEFCPTRTLVWSTAPVRAAAIYQMKRGHDRDFIKLAYHSLCHGEFATMPSAARSLYQQVGGGRVGMKNRWDLLCRAVRVFDSDKQQSVSAIRVKNTDALLEELRLFITQEMRGEVSRTVPKGFKAIKTAIDSNRTS